MNDLTPYNSSNLTYKPVSCINSDLYKFWEMNPNQKHNNEQKDKQNKNIAKCQDSNKMEGAKTW